MANSVWSKIARKSLGPVPVEPRREQRFVGTSPQDAKRKALNYWYANQNALKMNLREYSARLTLLPDARTIVFRAD